MTLVSSTNIYHYVILPNTSGISELHIDLKQSAYIQDDETVGHFIDRPAMRDRPYSGFYTQSYKKGQPSLSRLLKKIHPSCEQQDLPGVSKKVSLFD